VTSPLAPSSPSSASRSRVQLSAARQRSVRGHGSASYSLSLSLSLSSLLGVQFNALLRNGAEQRPPSFSTIGLSSATQFNACPLLKKRLLLSSLTAPCHHSYSYVLAHAGFNTSAGLCVRRLVTQAARRGEEKREGIELIDGVAPLS
jgi:hypothetical protein